MGKCASKQNYPTPFSINDLINLKQDEVKESPSGCCPIIAGRQAGSGYQQCTNRGFSYPDNGEFDFALGTNCNMCSDVAQGYGCDCDSQSILGKRPSVQRIAFKADPKRCCLENPPNHLIDGLTCPPETWNTNSQTCQKYKNNQSAPNFFNINNPMTLLSSVGSSLICCCIFIIIIIAVYYYYSKQQ